MYYINHIVINIIIIIIVITFM